MRILFIHRNARISGIVTYLRTLIPAMRRRGHECELMLRRGSASPRLRDEIGPMWWHPPVAGWAAARVERIVRRKAIDMVATQTPRCASHALSACRDCDLPLVMNVHGRTPLERCLDAAEYAAAIVLANENALAYYADKYPQLADKLRLVRLPIDRKLLSPDCRTGDCSAEPAVRVLYLARLSGTKGECALELISAVDSLLQTLPALQLRVVGSGSRLGPVRREAKRVNERAGRHVVEIVGNTLYPEEFVHRADIVVGAGYCALEGLACGCSVIGIGVAGLLGVVDSDNLHEAISCNFGDSGANWEHADAELLARQIVEAHRQMGDDHSWAQATIDEHFCCERVAGCLESVFEDAVRGG